MNKTEQAWSVSDFVAVFNQTIEYAYPVVTLVGELANFRVSKGRWVYFDLKDDTASVKFFGTVYQLPGPLEDGLMIEVTGSPRLHPQFGFSITAQRIQPVGEGSLKRAAALLETKLRSEGLFDESRKRPLPYPPRRIGLVASGGSAAYHDFIKILHERWAGVEIELADVQVQGEAAVSQIVAGLEYFSAHQTPPDVIVVTRGGGSADDLAAFSTEQVTRAVAASQVPTLVAIGHEVDISLAELAADIRASTPSNAAELLVPDRRHELDRLARCRQSLQDLFLQNFKDQKVKITQISERLADAITKLLSDAKRDLNLRQQVLSALSPDVALQRGYAIVREGDRVVVFAKSLKPGTDIHITLHDGTVQAKVAKKE